MFGIPATLLNFRVLGSKIQPLRGYAVHGARASWENTSSQFAVNPKLLFKKKSLKKTVVTVKKKKKKIAATRGWGRRRRPGSAPRVSRAATLNSV